MAGILQTLFGSPNPALGNQVSPEGGCEVKRSEVLPKLPRNTLYNTLKSLDSCEVNGIELKDRFLSFVQEIKGMDNSSAADEDGDLGKVKCTTRNTVDGIGTSKVETVEVTANLRNPNKQTGTIKSTYDENGLITEKNTDSEIKWEHNKDRGILTIRVIQALSKECLVKTGLRMEKVYSISTRNGNVSKSIS